MKEKFFSLFVFAFFAQLLLGQEKFTIRGEFPDNSLDGIFLKKRKDKNKHTPTA